MDQRLVPLLFCLALGTQSSSGELARQDVLDGLNQTFNVLDRLFSFFEDDVNKVNLDAVYGIRVAEGAFEQSLSDHTSFFQEDTAETKYIREQLVEFHKRASWLCTQAQKSIKEQDEFYYNRFKFVVERPWSFYINFGQKKLPPPVSSRVKKNDTVDHEWKEERSDKCMAEVLGTNAKHIKCVFTEDCVKSITDEQATLYGPTHQILFLTLALIQKCERKYSKILSDHVGLDVYGLIENRCVKILEEMVDLERQGVPEDKHDIYFEQSLVCGMHGYGEFMSLERLKKIAGWQLYPGCFGNLSRDDVDDSDAPGSLGDERRSRRNPEMYSSMRRLLVDVVLDHGCSSHESGVVAGLLALYTKWHLAKLDPIPLVSTTYPTEQHTTIEEKKRVAYQIHEVYEIAVLVSFLTTVVTLVFFFALYKLCKCFGVGAGNMNHPANPYKKLKPSSEGENMYFIS